MKKAEPKDPALQVAQNCHLTQCLPDAKHAHLLFHGHFAQFSGGRQSNRSEATLPQAPEISYQMIHERRSGADIFATDLQALRVISPKGLMRFSQVFVVFFFEISPFIFHIHPTRFLLFTQRVFGN